MSDAGSQVHFKAMRKLAAEAPAEVFGKEVRKLYSWSDEDKLINTNASTSLVVREVSLIYSNFCHPSIT